MANKALGTFRAVYLVALCCVGSFLFAYDTGIVGGILTFKSFQRDFRYGEEQRASVGSNSTSLLQAGGKLSHLSLALDIGLHAFDSLLCMFLHLALHGQVWSTLVHRASLGDLQRWCHRADHQHALISGLLRRACRVGYWRWYGDGSHPRVLGGDGAQEHPWYAGILLPVLLHTRCHDIVLD